MGTEVKKYELKQPSVAEYIQHRGGFYKVEGEYVPDAATVIKEAVKKGFSAEILEHKADEKGVEVVVRAKTPDGTYTDEWVRMEYLTEAYRLFIQKMLKKIKKKEATIEDIQVAGYVESPWGRIPAFKDPALNMLYQEQLIRTYTYLPRIVTTKAKARAFLQLLGKEYREDFEIEQEQSEVEQIQQEKEKKLSDKQLKYLHALINEYAKLRNIEPDVVKDTIKKDYGVEHTNELTIEQASEIITKIKSWIDNIKEKSAEKDEEPDEELY